jgi:hypothetical protein
MEKQFIDITALGELIAKIYGSSKVLVQAIDTTIF